MLVAGIALMIYCGPMGAAAMMALYGAIASTGFSMVLGGIAQKLQGQYSPAIGIAVKQPASPWNVVYGRSRVGGVIAYINTSSSQNTRLDLIVAHTGHHVARVGNAGRNGLAFGGLYLDGKEVLTDIHGDSRGGKLTDASGNEYSFDNAQFPLGDGRSFVHWETRQGAPGQVACYPLQNQQDPNWKPSCTLDGRGYSYISLTWDQNRFSNGIPGIRVDIVGKDDIYDPRVDVRGIVTINQDALNAVTGVQFPPRLNGANIIIEGAGPGVAQNGEPTFLLAHLTVDGNGSGTIDPPASQPVTNVRAYTCGYTENWALCVADYLCNKEFGLGCLYDTEIDEEQLIAAANICDELVPVRYSNLNGWEADAPYSYGQVIAPGNGYAYMCVRPGVSANNPPNFPERVSATVWDGPGPGGQYAVEWECKGLSNSNLAEPRYTMNGTFQTDTTPGDVLTNMMTAAAGRIVYIGGVWKIYPAAWYGVGIAITDDDLLGTVKWVPTRKFRDLVNAVRGTFIAPTFPYIHDGPGLPLNLRTRNVFDAQWQQADFPPFSQDPIHGYEQDQNYLADGSETLWQELRLPFTISGATAQRIAKIYLTRNRQQGTGTLKCKLSTLRAQALDVVSWTHPSMQFHGKLIEISNFRIKVDYEPTSELDLGESEEQNNEAKAPVIYCELDLQETDPSVYAWSSSEELPLDSPDILG